jgi:hypothetical protein
MSNNSNNDRAAEVLFLIDPQESLARGSEPRADWASTRAIARMPEVKLTNWKGFLNGVYLLALTKAYFLQLRDR